MADLNRPQSECLVALCEETATLYPTPPHFRPQTFRSLAHHGMIHDGYPLGIPTPAAWDWLVLEPLDENGETILRASGRLKPAQQIRVAICALRKLRHRIPEGWAARDRWFDEHAEGLAVIAGHGNPYVRFEHVRNVHGTWRAAEPGHGAVHAAHIYPAGAIR